jgi:glutamate dehydrogenase/leucine dehydrogenase
MLDLSPSDFIQILRSKGVSRIHFKNTDKKWIASHDFLQPIADYFNKDMDFDFHEAAFIAVGERSGVLMSAVVHRSHRGPGAGGVRNWYYDNVEAFIREGLRLSKGMTMKNALAGLWW